MTGDKGHAGRDRASHGTSDLHGTRPRAPAAWVSTTLAPETPSTPPPTIKHAWYLGGTLGRQPALLLSWRNTGGHWAGLICTLAPDGDGYAIVEMWVDAGLLAPA